MRTTLFFLPLYLVMTLLKAQSYEQQMEQAGQAIKKKDFCAALSIFKLAFTDTTKISRYDYAYAALAAANCQHPDQALTWLQMSQQKGLGLQAGEIEFVTHDSAFTQLHSSPGWNPLLTSMRQANDKHQAAKRMASKQWLESGFRQARLTASPASPSKQLPAGYALYFQPVDSVKVPYLVYVPDSFNVSKPTTLLIYLHGGVVNQATFAYDDPQVANEPIFQLANRYNALVLYPFARKDFGWVDQEKAFKNVLTILDKVKKSYPIPIKRVYLGGMSNGGTAAYWFATKHPEQFTGFYAFSPWPSLKVTSTEYAKLSRGKPFISVNAKDDTVFPYPEVKAIYQQQQSRATDWRFKTVDTGGHGFIYGPQGLLLIQAVLDELVTGK